MNTLNTLLLKTIKPLVFLAVVGFVAFSGASAIYAVGTWTAPTQVPPLGNTNPPINESSTGQVKSGGLSLGSLVVNGDSILYNRLGIGGSGAWTPNYEIDLRATDTAAIIRLANTTTGYTNTDGSWLYQGGANLLLRNREAGGIHFYTSDTDRGRIDSAGNMILGGTTPTTGLKLDVEGNVGAVLYCDETAANCFDAANVVTSATSTGTVGFWYENAGNVYRDTGSVGIGSNAIPKAQLDLSGTSRSDTPGTNQRLQFSSAATGLFGFRLSQDNTTLHLDRYWGSWGTPAISVVRGNGRVGINETAPTSGLALDVGGKVGATEYCDGDGLNCVLAGEVGGGLWEENGDDVYRASGGVAIGLTSTAHSLETAGDIRIAGNDLFAGAGQSLNWASAGYTRFNSNSATISALRLFNNAGDEYGRVYGANGDNIGFLDGDGAWAYQHIKDSSNVFKINSVTKSAQVNDYTYFNQGLYVYSDETDSDFFVRDTDKGTQSNVLWYDHSAGRVYLGNPGGSGANHEVTVRGALQITGGDDVSLLDDTGYVLLGSEGSANIAMDNNEILARNNGAAGQLHIQTPGGITTFGGQLPAIDQIHIPGDGTLVVGASSASTGLKLDVEGKVGATEYCDEAGANCTPASAISGGLWTQSGANIYRNTGNVSVGTPSSAAKLFSYTTDTTAAVYGQNASTGMGVYGHASANYGIGGRTLSATHGGVVGTSGDALIYGILGHANAYSLYGNGQVYTTGRIRTGADLATVAGHVYFGAALAQDLYGDNDAYLYYDSNNATTANIQLRRSDNTRIGSLYGYKSGTGASRIGFLDGDNNAAIVHYTDSFTRFYSDAREKFRINADGSAAFYGNDAGTTLTVNNTVGTAALYLQNHTVANQDAYTRYHTTSDGVDDLYWAIGTDGSAAGHPLRIRPGTTSDGAATNGLHMNRDGTTVFGGNSVSAGLRLDVEGKVGATEYCDQNGANCTAAALVGAGDNLGNHTATQNIILPTGFGVDFNHPTSGVAQKGWEDNYLRYRFGATNVPLGIRIDDYDTPRITLNRTGSAIFSGTVTGAAPTAGAHLTTKTYVDGLIATAGDDLGSHTATQALNMASFNINNAGYITASGRTNLTMAADSIGWGLNLYSLDASEVAQFHINNDALFRIRHAGLDRISIASDGDVGIGTNGPAAGLKLDVEGKVGATEYCDSAGANCITAAAIGGDNLGNHTATQMLDFNNAVSERISLYGTQYGIGIKSSTLALHSGRYVDFDHNAYGGTTYARIAAANGYDTFFNAGDVGIGLTNPTTALHIARTGDAVITLNADTDNVTETDHPTINFIQDGASVRTRVGYESGTNNFGIYNQFNGSLLFGTNNTTRLTIAGNGNATFTGTVSGITPTAGAHLTTKTYVDGQIAAAGGDNLGSGGTTSGTLYASNGSNQGFIGQGAQNYARWDSSGTTYYNKNGSWEYTMNATSFSPWTNNANSLGTATKRWSNMYSTLGNFSGAVTAASFVYSSDENLKTNITPLLNAKDILSLGTYTFDWKDGTAGSETKNAQGDIGIIAQEVEEIYPEFVYEDENGNKTVDYVKLVVPLLEVTKTQQSEIDELRVMIEELQINR